MTVFVLLILVACSGSGDQRDNDPRLHVVATTVQIGALAKEVGGVNISLVTLLKPGVDPHSFEPTPSDLKSIKSADVILANGLGLDDFLESALKGAGGGKQIVIVSEGVTVRRKEGQAEPDPHIWQNPISVKRMAENVAEAFAARDATNGTLYRERAVAYSAILDETDRQIVAIIDSIPAANRKMVTDHDAFGYFIERYGLAFVGAVIPGVSTQGEPSAKEIAALTDLIKREGVRAIFAEGTVDPKVAREIAKDTGVKIVGDLYGDSLGAPGSGAETVHGMLLANAKKIAEALK
jgi:ABC-type Zn uptake system ZnuABC Zn-binding protein ZnuA